MFLKDFIKKYTALPGPAELKMSKHNYLGSSAFSFGNKPNQATWEDWEKEVKILYPVRFFFRQTIPEWFRPLRRFRRRIDDVYYWLKDHIVTKNYLIDIREKTKLYKDTYKWGYIDPDTKIRLAVYSIFIDYIEKEILVHTSLKDYVQSDKSNDVMAEIYNWVKTERYVLRQQWSDMIKSEDNDPVKRKENMKKWFAMDDMIAQKDEEMFAKIIKNKDRLWF